jgi:3-dehydroquinate synthase
MLKKRGRPLTSIKMIDYDISIQKDVLNELPSFITKATSSKSLFIITDRHLFHLYHERLSLILNDFFVQYVTVEPGESSKSLRVYETVCQTLIEKGIRRSDFIIAFGGGVVGDLAGFVASTLYRGIPFAQIPTSLLAMVDSSIGGKVGIDLPQGKNVLGSFYNPKFVLIDPELLKTLSDREYENGIAEMIKAGLIGDKKLYHFLLEHKHVTENEIQMAICVKRELVLNDPYDFADRMKLNFGHTFGHAIEKKHHYQTYLHGEAISYGMLFALEIGMTLNETKPELYDEVKHLLIKRGLVKEPLLSMDDYKDGISHDKKLLSDGLHFIIVTKPGDSKIVTLKPEDL